MDINVKQGDEGIEVKGIGWAFTAQLSIITLLFAALSDVESAYETLLKILREARRGYPTARIDQLIAALPGTWAQVRQAMAGAGRATGRGIVAGATWAAQNLPKWAKRTFIGYLLLFALATYFYISGHEARAVVALVLAAFLPFLIAMLLGVSKYILVLAKPFALMAFILCTIALAMIVWPYNTVGLSVVLVIVVIWLCLSAVSHMHSWIPRISVLATELFFAFMVAAFFFPSLRSVVELGLTKDLTTVAQISEYENRGNGLPPAIAIAPGILYNDEGKLLVTCSFKKDQTAHILGKITERGVQLHNEVPNAVKRKLIVPPFYKVYMDDGCGFPDPTKCGWTNRMNYDRQRHQELMGKGPKTPPDTGNLITGNPPSPVPATAVPAPTADGSRLGKSWQEVSWDTLMVGKTFVSTGFSRPGTYRIKTRKKPNLQIRFGKTAKNLELAQTSAGFWSGRVEIEYNTDGQVLEIASKGKPIRIIKRRL